MLSIKKGNICPDSATKRRKKEKRMFGRKRTIQKTKLRIVFGEGLDGDGEEDTGGRG